LYATAGGNVDIAMDWRGHVDQGAQTLWIFHRRYSLEPALAGGSHSVQRVPDVMQMIAVASRQLQGLAVAAINDGS
jgi:hypothetical protein